jgi:hypothetical protein
MTDAGTRNFATFVRFVRACDNGLNERPVDRRTCVHLRIVF